MRGIRTVRPITEKHEKRLTLHGSAYGSFNQYGINPVRERPDIDRAFAAVLQPDSATIGSDDFDSGTYGLALGQ